MKKYILITLLAFSQLTPVFSNVDINDIFYTNIRQRAMGGVRVAIQDPTAAVYNNPATLSTNKKHHVTLPRFGAYLSDSAQDTIKKAQDLEGGNNPVQQLITLKELTPSSINSKLNSEILFWSMPNHGLGAYTNSHIKIKLQRKSSPEMILNIHNDVVVGYGYGKNFESLNNTAIGITAKYVGRSASFDAGNTNNPNEFKLSANDIIDVANDTANNRLKNLTYHHSNGFLFDLGILRSYKNKYGDGHWGVSFYNIGPDLEGIPQGSTETIKSDINSSLVIGTTLKSKSKNIFLKDTLFAFDYDLSSPDNRFKKNFHMGIERTLFDVFHIRGGLNQGYIVGGFGFTVKISGFPILHFDYAHHTEELGSKVGHEPVSYHAFEIGLLY